MSDKSRSSINSSRLSVESNYSANESANSYNMPLTVAPAPSVNSPNTAARLARLLKQASEADNLAAAEAEVDIPDDGEEDIFRFSWRKFWAYTGPGWLMSIAYLDPGNLTSDLQAGAFTGYQLISILFIATVVGLILQILACRLGVVTGKHLAEVAREQYSRPVSLTLWLMAEVAIIGSDIQEVIGSSIAIKILTGIPLYAGVLITGADTFTFLAIHYLGVRKLEAFFALLISIMAVCFFVDFGYMNPPGGSIMYGFLPIIDDYAVLQAVSLIGAVIMPHNLYLHSALVQSRKVDRSRRSKIHEANVYFSIEAVIALAVSFLINMAVVAVFAEGYYDEICATGPNGPQARVDGECQDLGLDNAGDALKGPLGSAAMIVWAVGLLAAGQSSTMTGTYAGQFVMEGFLTLKLPNWQRTLLTRGIALGPALAVALIGAGDTSIDDQMSEWLNVIQSLQLPFALLPLLHFSSDRNLMGEFAIGAWLEALIWFIALVVVGTNFYLVQSQVFDPDQGVGVNGASISIFVIVSLVYVGFLVYIIKVDLIRFREYLKVEIIRFRAWIHSLFNKQSDKFQPLLDEPVAADANYSDASAAL